MTFIMCEPGDAVRLDPADYDDGQTAARAEQIFETLVEFDGATTNVRPALAEKWDTSADGKTWTFYLRKGVKFHDGTPFNADAVIWNYNAPVGREASLPHPRLCYLVVGVLARRDRLGLQGREEPADAGHQEGG